MHKLTHLSLFILLLVLTRCGSVNGDKNLVKNIDEFNQAIVNAQPGTVITMANGVWTDVELIVKGRGEKDNPITLQAETPGKVLIEGQSYLELSGEYLVISGLVFQNGYTPTSTVISFRTSSDEIANNCRVTNCVIKDFSNPERFESDFWVLMYGKNNMFDHNSLIGKRNLGVTMAIRLNTEESRENNHIVEYNYFGPRQILGSNGGETFRIGTSHYSRTYSNTIVRGNYFDRTNGEHEIISNKSCGNEFRDNVFFECQGTLTMRHGHHTLVENNYFLGNRKPNTGGIRIINEYQTVRKNYLYGLTGYRFRGALVIMNGVPNSPINRYNQVVDSHMQNNLVINSDYIQLCAGSDEERSAVPVGSSFTNNLILGTTNPEPFTIYDDVSGIEFAGNVMSKGTKRPFEQGFSYTSTSLEKNKHGLLVPSDDLLESIDFGDVTLPVTKEEVGASYFPKSDETISFGSSQTIEVPAGANTLIEALEASQPGSILKLENGGEYLLTKYAIVKHPVSLITPEGDKATILSEKQTFFKIENGGALQFDNIRFDGAQSPDYVGNNVISTSKYSMNINYALVVENCEVKDLDKNHSFDFLKAYKDTFADSIQIINTTMSNITGHIISLDMETEDRGIYNVENLKIEGSAFTDVQGAIANIYRGGTDESTFGPIVEISEVEVTGSGMGSRNKLGSSFRFHGVQKLIVNNVEVMESEKFDLFMTNGEPITQLTNITFINSKGLKTNGEPYQAENIINQ